MHRTDDFFEQFPFLLDLHVSYLQKTLKTVTAKTAAMQNGTLMVSTEGGRPAFFLITYFKGKRRRNRITSNLPLVYYFANKAYLTEYAARLAKNIRTLSDWRNDLVSTEPEDIISSMPKHFDTLDPFLIIHPELASNSKADSSPKESADLLMHPSSAMPAAQISLNTGNLTAIEWGIIPYRVNTKFVENKIHLTENGIAVRSKGEAMILSLYSKKNIPHHYDEVFTISEDTSLAEDQELFSWKSPSDAASFPPEQLTAPFHKMRYISPDITAARADGTLFFHEHCGLHTDDYRNGILNKLLNYASCGIRLGENLLLTFEDENGGIDLELISAAIDNMYNRTL